MANLFVKVENNAVTQCWDTPYPANEAALWRDAIEVRPTIIQGRQCYTQHTFDLTKNPVEIVWGVYDIPVDERKTSLTAQLNGQFQMAQMRNPDWDAATIAVKQAELDINLAAVTAATTHDALDLIVIPSMMP